MKMIPAGGFSLEINGIISVIIFVFEADIVRMCIC